MNSLHAYAAAQAGGMDIIAGAQGMSVAELISLGLNPYEASQIFDLHTVYFGKTSNSRKQALARTTSHNIATLKRIEFFACKIKDPNKAWDLRKELAFTAAAAIDSVARKRIAEWNTPTSPKRGVFRSFHNDGLASLRIVASADKIQDVYANVRESEDQVEAFLHKFFDGGASPTQIVTNVVVTLEDGIKILRREVDDVILQLTNGTQMSGHDYLEAKVQASGWATLVTPSGQPIYAGRTQRLANETQRVMASAQNPTCAWDERCKRPADECQVHHIVAHQYGGTTDPENLVMLCAFHNGRNDDDPAAEPINGRIERVDGKPTRVFARGSTAPG